MKDAEQEVFIEQDQPVDASASSGESFSTPNIYFESDPKLVAEGWERRFMANPDEIEDIIRLYTELGFQVHTEAIQTTELSAICGDCRLATCRTYVTIYTRKSSLPKDNLESPG